MFLNKSVNFCNHKVVNIHNTNGLGQNHLVHNSIIKETNILNMMIPDEKKQNRLEQVAISPPHKGACIKGRVKKKFLQTIMTKLMVKHFTSYSFSL